ncbi:MAG: hypothetical protein A2X87_06310 [Deltaproteobacteria bacterium GWC2_42_51]|nr:MAG: hypothetical protein A2056_01115 [Deltaproteobacteria bacterium GWA2_42_85]OGP32006.1 MAG: hypothetical protein A2X87_06310 [Deltaproteobacteria bacterium GWC2_42_51]OGP38130.1 MAG: hypothetical protein A2090_11500 [Deltaproteobacteria bacterium GWD2_42_10]OGP48250.1 MAG: hypothetical protein A2022_03525 [Deltaproteobacteria bacterium GWF2_42_12]OGQ25090.1 MAG: hypothetical protein A3D29_09245 [Deltaproteobacteria bacterium RIFCSPHIGHO2_02_FULL_42_44]OGQ38246.1 MAG: hypothetical protei
MALITSPEAAARLARTILSDIAIYNKEKVKEGLKNDNLFEVLEKELKEGEDLYKSRVDPTLLKKTNFFNKAIVDILIKRSGDVESEIW